ncbi:17930_t:CDS:2, partial [Entrophospora sp. SA101]
LYGAGFNFNTEFQLEAKTTMFGGTSNGEAPPNPLYIFDTTSKS